MLREYVVETEVSAVGLDSVTDAAAAVAACPTGTVFQGNLDPLVIGALAGRCWMRGWMRC